MGNYTYSKIKSGRYIAQHKLIPTKILSILLAILMVTTIFSSMTASARFSDKTLKERIENFKEKTGELIEDLSSKNLKKSDDKTSNPTLLQTMSSISRLSGASTTLTLYTNYNGTEKTNELKLFRTVKVDVDGDGDDDVGAKLSLYPSIERPFSLSINFGLKITRLNGFNDVNADFKVYAEFNRPGTLDENSTGDKIRWGYHSPNDELVPNTCIATYKLIPHIFDLNKKPEHKVHISPSDDVIGKADLDIILSYVDPGVQSDEFRVSYSPASESQICFGRQGGASFSITKEITGNSKVDLTLTHIEDSNTTYAYVYDLPGKVSFVIDLGREGKIEFNTHGEKPSEIGLCDDIDNPVNKIYFSNLFTNAKIEWNRDILFLLKNVKANISIYAEGEEVSFNVYLEGEGNGSVNFSAESAEAIIDIFMELDLAEGYFVLQHSTFDLSVSLVGHGPDQGTLDASFDLKKTEDNPFEIFFDGLKEGNAEIYLAGKSFEINNLDIKMSSYLSFLTGEYSISMDHLEKTKEGSIGSTFSIIKEDKNLTINCSINIVHGVKITNLSLKFNDFEFERTDIDETGTITHWYNFSLNVTDVEWYDYGDWGYILIYGDSSAYFSFDSTYWDGDELVGTISGVIQLQTINDVFNISWETIDGNKTYFFDGSGVVGLYDFKLWIKDKINVSIPKLSANFVINTNKKSGEVVLFFGGSSSLFEVEIEKIDINDLFGLTFHGEFDINVAGSSSGTIGIGWNETGRYFFDTDFDLDITGSITVTDFLLAYQENLINISFTELIISGNLNINLSTEDDGLSISGDSELTNIVISDLSATISISKPLQISLDANVTFDGNGDITVKYVNGTILLNGNVSGDSEILVNQFWFLVPIPAIPMEVNIDNLVITGFTSISFDVNNSLNTPVMINIYSEEEITADIIYLGLAPYLQLYFNEFVGGGTGGNLGIGWNMKTSQPVFNFDHSSCSIGIFQIIIQNSPLVEISDLSIDGTLEIEGFFDIGGFTFVYIKGVVYEDTTITLEKNIPVIGLCNISIIFEPGKLDILLQQDLILLLEGEEEGDFYLFGYSSGWITIKVNDIELVKIMGIMDLWIHVHISDDGTIAGAFDAKDVSGAVVIANSLRFAGEANAKLEFSIKIVEENGTTTFSDLYLNLTGQMTAVIQIKTDESDWIPVLPFSTTGQVVMIRQPGFMCIPNIVDDFEIYTLNDNFSLIFEVWYAPPLGEDSDSIGPFTYDVDFDDGTSYETTTDDTRIVLDPQLYDLGSYTPSVTVTPSDSAYAPVDDTISFTILKEDPTYLELVEEGPTSLTYDDVESDGRFHTWMTVRNKAEEGYIIDFTTEFMPWEYNIEELEPITYPESGVLNPGESVTIEGSFLPFPDHKEHQKNIWLTVNNTNYVGTYPEEDGQSMGIDIKLSLSVIPSYIYLPSLNPGESRTSSFWLWNNKDEALTWSITDYPNTHYSFSTTSGTIPRFGTEVVQFTVLAPNEEGVDLSGDIEITDMDDPLNVVTTWVTVKTKGNNSNDHVTITEDENGNVSIAIGGLNEIHINNFQFEINGISGELNGHFIFDFADSYVYINFTKNDLKNLSLDGNAEFSIENFKFAYGDGVLIEISKVITGGFRFTQGKSGKFNITINDTFTDVNVYIDIDHSGDNFHISGVFNVDITGETNGSLCIEWDLNGENPVITFDGYLEREGTFTFNLTDLAFMVTGVSITAEQLLLTGSLFNLIITGDTIDFDASIDQAAINNLVIDIDVNEFPLFGVSVQLYGTLDLSSGIGLTLSIIEDESIDLNVNGGAALSIQNFLMDINNGGFALSFDEFSIEAGADISISVAVDLSYVEINISEPTYLDISNFDLNINNGGLTLSVVSFYVAGCGYLFLGEEIELEASLDSLVLNTLAFSANSADIELSGNFDLSATSGIIIEADSALTYVNITIADPSIIEITNFYLDINKGALTLFGDLLHVSGYGELHLGKDILIDARLSSLTIGALHFSVNTKDIELSGRFYLSLAGLVNLSTENQKSNKLSVEFSGSLTISDFDLNVNNGLLIATFDSLILSGYGTLSIDEDIAFEGSINEASFNNCYFYIYDQSKEISISGNFDFDMPVGNVYIETNTNFDYIEIQIEGQGNVDITTLYLNVNNGEITAIIDLIHISLSASGYLRIEEEKILVSGSADITLNVDNVLLSLNNGQHVIEATLSISLNANADLFKINMVDGFRVDLNGAGGSFILQGVDIKYTTNGGNDYYYFYCDLLDITISGGTGYLEFVDDNLIIDGSGQITVDINNMVITINGPVLGNDFNVELTISSFNVDVGVNAKELVIDLSGKPEGPPLRISPKSATIHVGDSTLQLTAYTDEGVNIIWSSEDSSIASVDQNGLVTAHEIGEVNIIATTDTDPATEKAVKIKVIEDLPDFYVSPTEANLEEIGDTLQLTAYNKPSGSITWHSSNNAVASVDSSGLVTLNSLGQAEITAKVNGISSEPSVINPEEEPMEIELAGDITISGTLGIMIDVSGLIGENGSLDLDIFAKGSGTVDINNFFLDAPLGPSLGQTEISWTTLHVEGSFSGNDWGTLLSLVIPELNIEVEEMRIEAEIDNFEWTFFSLNTKNIPNIGIITFDSLSIPDSGDITIYFDKIQSTGEIIIGAESTNGLDVVITNIHLPLGSFTIDIDQLDLHIYSGYFEIHIWKQNDAAILEFYMDGELGIDIFKFTEGGETRQISFDLFQGSNLYIKIYDTGASWGQYNLEFSGDGDVVSLNYDGPRISAEISALDINGDFELKWNTRDHTPGAAYVDWETDNGFNLDIGLESLYFKNPGVNLKIIGQATFNPTGNTGGTAYYADWDILGNWHPDGWHHISKDIPKYGSEPGVPNFNIQFIANNYGIKLGGTDIWTEGGYKNGVYYDHFIRIWLPILERWTVGSVHGQNIQIFKTENNGNTWDQIWPLGNQNPVADAGGPYSGDPGVPISFDASGSSDPNGDALQYQWDWDNDGNYDTGWLNSPYIDHTFYDSGTITVKLQVRERYTFVKRKDTDTATVSFGNEPPTLSNCSITPNYGYPFDNFEYVVKYTDLNNDEPTIKRVYIKKIGDPTWSYYTMIRDGNPDYANGVYYRYETDDLTVGDYECYFEFSDGQSTVTSNTYPYPHVQPEGEWIHPDNVQDPDDGWIDENKAKDGNTGTYAESWPLYYNVFVWRWTEKIVLTLNEPTKCDKVQTYALQHPDYIKQIRIDVFWDGSWHNNIVNTTYPEFTNHEWNIWNLPGEKNVTKARVSFCIRGYLTGTSGELNEFEFHKVNT